LDRNNTAGRVAGWSATHPAEVICFWVAAVVLSLFAWHGADQGLITGTSVLTDTESRSGSALIDTRFTDTDTTSTKVLCAVPGIEDASMRPGELSGRPVDPVSRSGVFTSVGKCYEAKWAASSGMAPPSSLFPPENSIGWERPLMPDGSNDPEVTSSDALALLLPATIDSSALSQSQGDSLDQRYRAIVQEDLVRAELVAVPLTLLILFVVIRSWFSPFIPIIIGAIAVAVAIGLISVAARISSMSIYVVNMIVMVGMAVGIDYTLLIVERYREERRAGRTSMEAIELSFLNAGRAVMASGMAVIVALFGMLFVPISVFRDIALGAMLVVVTGVAAALTALPAILKIMGERVDLRRSRCGPAFLTRHKRSPFWHRWAKVVTRHAWSSALLVLVVLGVLAAQSMHLQLGISPLSTDPASESGLLPKTEYWEREAAATLMSVVEVVVDGAHLVDMDGGINSLVAHIGQDADFAPVVTVQTNETGDLTIVRALVVRPPSSSEAETAIERLRTEVVPNAFATPSSVFVSGPLALQWDLLHLIETWQPRIIGFVLGLSFIVLMLVFRSIIISTMATLLTLLTVSSSIGVLTLVIQEGYGASLLGLEQTEMIEVWIPITLFCILFGLSMDYHMFLVSRIHEHYRQSGDSTASIVLGVRSTGTVICGAALIMAVVFASFAGGRLLILQQVGFGLAVAVLIDAFLVRLILVPAVMALLDRWNWYWPDWFGWLPDGKWWHKDVDLA